MTEARKEAEDLAPKGHVEDRDAVFDSICNDGGGGKRASLLVHLWRFLVCPILSALLRVAMRSSVTTAQSMLLMRTYFAHYKLPHANEDDVAPLFLDEMLPGESAMFKEAGLRGELRGRLMIAPIVGVPGIGRFIDIRTAWLDGCTTAALDAGATQVVVIAAGYDTRAYRLHRPGVKFFEIDLPYSSKSKQELVSKCLPDASRFPRPTYIAADLSEVSLASALQGSGFDASKKTIFLAEGLIYYLPPNAVRVLFESVASLAAPGSRFCLDWLRLSVLSGRAFNPGFETLATAVSNRGEPFKSALDDVTPSALDDLGRLFGFRCTHRATAKELATRLYKGSVEWSDFPATATTCYAYAEFERA